MLSNPCYISQFPIICICWQLVHLQIQGQTDDSEGQLNNSFKGLLIDLRSPGDEVGQDWSEISIVDTDHVQSDAPSDDKLRDLSFTDIALRNNPVPILSQLPENASSLHIDSFVPVDLTTPNMKLAGDSKGFEV